jgi:hypothetical protein
MHPPWVPDAGSRYARFDDFGEYAMNNKETAPHREETGVDDVRRVREKIARDHNGDLAAHVAETNRIAEELRRRLRLGRVVPPPTGGQRSGTEG